MPVKNGGKTYRNASSSTVFCGLYVNHSNTVLKLAKIRYIINVNYCSDLEQLENKLKMFQLLISLDLLIIETLHTLFPEKEIRYQGLLGFTWFATSWIQMYG